METGYKAFLRTQVKAVEGEGQQEWKTKEGSIPKATSDLMIHQKDTQVLEKLMYAWLLFNTVKQYRLNQQRERAHEEKCRSNQAQASKCPLPVQLHRHI